MSLPSELLRREVERIRWYHTIDFGNGIVSKGVDDSPRKLRRLHLPDDLSGLSVLDIGAWDGFFSFEAERRGARRVLAVDSYSWNGQGWGTKGGFDLAHSAFGSRVESRTIDLLDVSPATTGTFDLVLFLGVLYHLRDPLPALERVASVTGRQLILETHVDLLHCRRPAVVFYPGTELNNDPTNWIGPNPAAVTAMLKTVGFREVRLVHLHSPLRRLAWALHRRLKGDPFLATLQQGRAVFHAWR